MLSSPRFINDGTQQAPRLVIYGNDWGLSQLPRWPHERPWTYEETLDRIRAAGFDGIQSDPSHADLIRAKGLRYAMSGRANTPAEIDDIARRAFDSGADSLTLHVGWGMEDERETDALALAVLKAADRHHLSIFIETHRATITQDLYRTLRLIERIPQLRFNGDFSHFYCSHEFPYRGFEVNLPLLGPILQRVAFFHGRISDAQCMQIDVGDGRDNHHALNFKRIWREGMRAWLAVAGPGDLLPFTPELGPPTSRYSITYEDSEGRRCEISDRWQQTLVLKRLAEECFTEADSNGSARQNEQHSLEAAQAGPGERKNHGQNR